MKKYKILIEGRNFLINLDGQEKKVGFYTTRFIEAGEDKTAKQLVIDSTYHDLNLKREILNKNIDPPLINVESIEEVKDIDASLSTGFSFFLEEDNQS